MLHQYWQSLAYAFMQNADAETANGAKAYMRNQFDFFGIKSPLRKQLVDSFFLEHSLPSPNELDEIIRSAWSHPCREMQYSAMELLFKVKKKATVASIHTYTYMITNKSWWDTVDFIAPKLVSAYFEQFPEQRNIILNSWLSSGNIWLQRSCILFQLKAKKKTDIDLLYEIIVQLAHEKDFFIRKAIGWALRELAKSEPEKVRNFVETHSISSLSKREALKHLN